MKKITFIIVSFVILFSACEKDDLSGTLDDVLYVRYKNAEMPAYIHGNGSEKIFLIILHGGPGGKAMEYRVGALKDLEERYAIVYFDQRGSGMSSGNYSKKDITPELMAEDILALVKVLKFKYGNDLKLFLLGHSWGGALGTRVLLMDQSPFKGWIEVDGGHNLVDMFDYQVTRFLEVADEQISEGNSVDFWTDLKSDVNEIKEEGYSDENGGKLNELGHSTEERLMDDHVLDDKDKVSVDFLNYLYEESIIISSVSSSVVNGNLNYLWTTLDYTPQLNQITIPSMIMWGEYDLVIPYSMGVEAYNAIGSTDKYWVLFHGSAHSPMMNEVKQFEQEVITFIEAHK
jgi:pimeloyl-ACP methyl ester carboxylesterase